MPTLVRSLEIDRDNNFHPRSALRFERGDHVCAVYATSAELAREVATFIADGLRRHERCWYVAAGHELSQVRASLGKLGIDVAAETRRGALQLKAGDAAYSVQGEFDPEATIRIFNDAIEQSYTDGFSGFRAAAEMSWALDCADGGHQVVVYEAMLKSLFETCRAIGLCLYDRTRMPLDIINGALVTHPVAGSHGHYSPNPFYDPATTRLPAVADHDVLHRLAQLDGPRGSAGDV